MNTAEALSALKPLITQHRAIGRLEEVLLEAHRLEGLLPVMLERVEEAKAEAEASEAATAASVAADRTRREQAKGKADDAIAALEAQVKAAEADAARRLTAIEDRTHAKTADLAERVKALEAKLAAVVKATEEAETKRAAVTADLDALAARLKG